jgi:retron-type reverse transcriptase
MFRIVGSQRDKMPYKIALPNPNTTSAFDLFISHENFQLAWERVRYFDRPDSRDWIGLKVFAANHNHNLEVLRQSIIQRTFVPSAPEIKYFPKASQTLRPMAIMAVKDRVVFQAIANVIAEKGRSTLSIIANRQSFANILQEPDKIPIFIHWEQQHQKFQKRFTTLFDQGNVWLVETDIAAFYEMIDHKRLFEILLRNGFLDEPVLSYLEAYLPIWALIKKGNKASRGVPQGCLASDMLAGVYLHELDEMLAAHECHYLRYVDDISITTQCWWLIS